MTLRGNFLAFYSIEVLTGILIAILVYFFGDVGLLGIGLFFIGMALTMKKDFDEREVYMSYKINSYEAMFIAAIMTITYFKFPDANWFYVFAVSALIVRGVIGIISFKMK